MSSIWQGMAGFFLSSIGCFSWSLVCGGVGVGVYGVCVVVSPRRGVGVLFVACFWGMCICWES